MSPSDLEMMLLENPTKPHKLVLASGDEVILPNARSASIDGISLRIVNYLADDRLAAKGTRLVSIPNIVLAELLPERPTGRRRR